VHAIGFDRHKRLVAKITTPDDQDLGLEHIKVSLAWWYERYPQNSLGPGARDEARPMGRSWIHSTLAMVEEQGRHYKTYKHLCRAIS
jgi:endonuclease YncB( thermonuclease family)